jgi:lysophospholipase L1-like esterase
MTASRAGRSIAGLALAIALMQAGLAQAAAPSNPCADGPVTQPLVANANRLGVIDLYFFFALGAPVDYFECVEGQPRPLGRRQANDTLTPFTAATTWRCARLERYFAATATLPNGSLGRGTGSIRTRSCARRFDVSVPVKVSPGRVARVRIRDRWHVGGVRGKLCVTRPAGRPRCRTVVFADAAVRTRMLRMDKRGRWRVELRVAGHTTRYSIAVGVPPLARPSPPPTLLAAGDSTMDGLDAFLADKLGGDATVESDVTPGIGFSQEDAWQRRAVMQVKRYAPQTTVVSIGANEGFPMRGADGAMHECCDEQWIGEYARRVRRAMLTYGKRVFWCTIVGPKDEQRRPIIAAVNDGILRAATGLAEVRIVRLDQVFTPNGYQEVIRYDGRDVRVREPDGVHLNIAGAEIAAREVLKALRAAGDG